MADDPQAPQAGTPPGGRDPTELTTEQIMREIAHLRDLMESRMDRTDRELDGFRRTSKEAVDAALAASDKAIIELDASTTRRVEAVSEMTDAKFVTHRTLLDSQSEKVALALAAANKAVDAAFASSKEAITKAETFNEKRFDIIDKDTDETRKRLAAIEAAVGNIAAGKVGAKENKAGIYAALAAAVAVLGILMFVANFLAGGS